MDICKSVSYILIFIPISMLHLNYPPHTIDISPFPLKNSPSPLPSPSPNQSPSVPRPQPLHPASQPASYLISSPCLFQIDLPTTRKHIQHWHSSIMRPVTTDSPVSHQFPTPLPISNILQLHRHPPSANQPASLQAFPKSPRITISRTNHQTESVAKADQTHP